MADEFDLKQTLVDHIEERLDTVHVAVPARVERYDPELQEIDALPLVKRRYYDETDEPVDESQPIVTAVPVVFPGGPRYRITWPIGEGDTVLLICSSDSLEDWLAEGGEVPPHEGRRFSLTDSIAIPGLHDFGHPYNVPPLPVEPGDGISIAAEDGIAIKVRRFEGPPGMFTDRIELGGDSEFAALGTTLKAHLDALKTLLDTIKTHTHPANGGGPIVASVDIGTVPSVPTVESTKVKLG